MKRKIIPVIALVISLIMLASCGNISDIQLPALPSADSAADSQNSVEEVPADSGEPAEASAAVQDPCTVIVSVKEFEKIFDAPDGSGASILRFEYSTPVIYIDENPEASNAINDYLNSTDEAYYSGSERYSGINYYHELALDNYSYVKETGKEINTDFYSIRKFTCRRCDNSAISFIYTTYDYFGIASENYSSEAFNFNTKDGSIMDFSALADDADQLIDACAEYLSETDIVNADNLHYLAENNGWFMDAEGLNFLVPQFSSLEDVQFYCVPYSALKEILYPQFVSNKYDSALKAEVTLADSDSFSDNTYSIIDRVQIDDNAPSSFLVIDGTAYDISVSSVEYNDFDGSFFVTDTIWYCSSLSECAVQMEVLPPTGIPEVMISYSDSDNNLYRLLVAEGDTAGSITLTDEDIVPLG